MTLRISDMVDGAVTARAGDAVYLYKPGRWQRHAIICIDRDKRCRPAGRKISIACLGEITRRMLEVYDIRKVVIRQADQPPPVKHLVECAKCQEHLATPPRARRKRARAAA